MIFTNEVKVIIGVSAVGIGLLVAGNLVKDIKVHYVDAVDKKMHDTRDPSVSAFEARVKNLKDTVSNITGKETKDISLKVAEFKKTMNYSDKVKEYKNAAKEGVESFKESINADAMIESANTKYEKAIYNYKVENNYDSKLRVLKKQISDAEEKYTNAKAMYKQMPEQYKESAKAFKKAAKETRNEIVEAAKKDIKELEEQYESFRIKEETIRDAEIKSINSQIESKKLYFDTDANNRIKILDKQISDYRDEVSKKIFAKRTEQDQRIIDEYESCKKELDGIHVKEAAERSEHLETASFAHKAALYLHDKGWKQWQIISIGAIPVVALEYWIVKYVRWIFNFSKMVKEGAI